jgi:hypothetical protein
MSEYRIKKSFESWPVDGGGYNSGWHYEAQRHAHFAWFDWWVGIGTRESEDEAIELIEEDRAARTPKPTTYINVP